MKKGSQTKKTVIKRIKALIEKQGHGKDKVVTIADMEASSSPCIKHIGETAILAEIFGQHKATVFTYVGDIETNEDYISYEDLDRDVLDEILVLLEDYDVAMDKFFDSCLD